MKRSARIAVFVLGAAILSGCSYLVDEDQSDCGGSLGISYRLRLVTNERTELETVLSEVADSPVKDALQAHLSGIFTDIAHDVDLSFYDESGERVLQLNEIMDKEHFECKPFLPAATILHGCVANVADNGPVTLEGDSEWPHGELVQGSAEGIADPQRTGLFTARKTFEVRALEELHEDVDLYIVNSATALVLETAGAEGIELLQVYVTGFADSFNVADSSWSFTSTPLVRTTELQVAAGTQRCFASVHFPSRDWPGTRTVTDSQEPFVSDPAPEPLWEWRIYTRIEDGSVIESLLQISNPLRAGQLKVLKAKLLDNGVVSVTDPTVGVSVTLDWNENGNHEIEF